jgi:hypothetical protein
MGWNKIFLLDHERQWESNCSISKTRDQTNSIYTQENRKRFEDILRVTVSQIPLPILAESSEAGQWRGGFFSFQGRNFNGNFFFRRRCSTETAWPNLRPSATLVHFWANSRSRHHDLLVCFPWRKSRNGAVTTGFGMMSDGARCRGGRIHPGLQLARAFWSWMSMRWGSSLLDIYAIRKSKWRCVENYVLYRRLQIQGAGKLLNRETPFEAVKSS